MFISTRLTAATAARATLLATLLALGGCAAGGDISKPIPSVFYPATQDAQRTVVMLPGIADNLAALQKRHVALLIQKEWPDADVVLAGLTLPFYKQGQAPQRLHDEVIQRYRKANQPLWLAGISLGGMGVLLYDRQYPDDAAGLLLMSPYLGEDDVREDIRAAGGLAHWKPESVPEIETASFSQDLWLYLKRWSNRPQRTSTIWLAYGAEEKFRKSNEMIAPMLSTDHVIMLPGKHDWDLWQRAFPALLKRAENSTSLNQTPPNQGPSD